MYIAVTYIGSRYVPGETISEDTPKEKLDWLKRAGAIREAAPDPEAPVMAEAPEDKGPEAQAPDPEPDDPETEAPEDEIDEDAEAPEIDVMAGIIQDTATPENKPGTARRRTPKGGKSK